MCNGWLNSVGLCLFSASVILAQDKPEPPRIALAAPFAVHSNATTKIVIRGWALKRDIAAKTTADGVTLKVLKHDNATAPNGQDVKQIGDWLVELEVTLPERFQGESLSFTLVADGVESPPYSLLVGGKFPVVAELEPNDGFPQAQPLKAPCIVDGQIHVDRNVDVYAVDLTVAGKLHAEVIARRQGSGLDSLLSVFDGDGRKIAVNDDTEVTDSRIEAQLDAGRYFLVVQDALDHGGPAHPYRLIVQTP